VLGGGLTPEQKQSVAQQVGCIVAAMRRAPAEGRRIGGCDGPVRDCRQFTEYTGGPFETEAECNAFVLDLLRDTPAAVRNALAGS